MSILEIAIVGAILSFVVQLLKKQFGTEGTQTKLLTAGLALLVGGVVYFLQDTSYWETVLGVLASASTVYAFLLNK